MNPHELKIGNYVEVEGVIVKVVSISKNKDGNIEVGVLRNKTTERVSEVNPMLLSKNLLAKHCGFNEKGQCSITIKRLKYFLKLEGNYIVLQNKQEESMIHYWDVRYLHQLQNLYFALKGKEMPVKF